MKIAVTLKQSYDIDVLLDLETSLYLWQTSYSEEIQPFWRDWQLIDLGQTDNGHCDY